MDQHYFLVCPVNSQNEEKLAGQGEARLRPLRLPQAWWLAGRGEAFD